ncbi:MAG TPA: hypothetical protein VKQ52_15575 [Puia sp.]|nr:hypothetical protein [Puia sp.]
MNNPFRPGSSWYPIRWFLVLIATLTMGMTYVDVTGLRFLSSAANQQPQRGGYYGTHYYHK